MKLNTRRGVQMAALTAAGALATWALADGNPTRSMPQDDAASAGKRPAAQCALAVGQRFAYQGISNTDMNIDMAPLARKMQAAQRGAVAMAAPAPQMVEAKRTWRLDAEVIGTTGSGSTILAAQLGNFETTVIAGDMKQSTPSLDAPFLIRVDERCTIEQFGWRRSDDLEAARQQQVILSALSLRYAEPEGPQRFSAIHFDVNGRYRANTMVVPDGIAARGLTYTQVFANTGADQQFAVNIENAFLHATASQDAWFGRLKRSHHVDYRIEDTSIGYVKSDLTVERVAMNADWQVTVDPHDDGWVWGLLLETTADSVVQADTSEQKAVSTTDALATLKAMLEGGTTPVERHDYLVRWLRANPNAVKEILALIEAGELDGADRMRVALFHAMASANTPATRAGLMHVLESDDFAYGYRVDAAQAAILMTPPPADLLPQLLNGAANGPDAFGRGSMNLSVGMYAAQHEAQHPALAAEARDALRDALATAQGEEARIQALQAAGNAAHDDLIPDIEPYLEAEDPQVRGYAADALRNGSPDEVLPLLETTYLSEDEPGVRMRALAAASEVTLRNRRRPSARMRDAVVSQLSDTDSLPEYTRMAEFLGHAAEAGDETARAALKTELKTVLANEPNNHERIETIGRFAAPRWAAK